MRLESVRLQLVIYIVLTFAMKVPFNYLMIKSHSIVTVELLSSYGIIWCPALATIIVFKLSKRVLSELGWSWGNSKWQLVAWFIPLLYTSISYCFVWATGLGKVPNLEFLQQTTADMALHLDP